jgi:hypothetical protein
VFSFFCITFPSYSAFLISPTFFFASSFNHFLSWTFTSPILYRAFKKVDRLENVYHSLNEQMVPVNVCPKTTGDVRVISTVDIPCNSQAFQHSFQLFVTQSQILSFTPVSWQILSTRWWWYLIAGTNFPVIIVVLVVYYSTTGYGAFQKFKWSLNISYIHIALRVLTVWDIVPGY